MVLAGESLVFARRCHIQVFGRRATVWDRPMGCWDGVRWDHGVLRAIPGYGGAVPSGNGLWEMRTRTFGLPAWSLSGGLLSIVGTS